MRISTPKLVRLLAPALVLAACAGDAPDPTPRKCTHVLYEVCATEHDCNSGNCKTFMGDGFQACTQSCDAANPCPPDLDGNEVACNNMGVCKPAAPIECEP
jgi:hypothetical protein